MPEGLYSDPLTPDERAEFEEDLISFCDDQLDLLGDIRDLDVLYAGGTSPLWIEGLIHRIGQNGSLTALDLDDEALDNTRDELSEAGLETPFSLVAGDVFDPPFEDGTFDIVYSAGLFHELEVSEESAEEALEALVRVVRAGGRVATADFVDSIWAAQVEEEHLRNLLVNELFGRNLYGIGPPERLVTLHETFSKDLSWRILPPHTTRHFEKLVLAEDEPPVLHLLSSESRDRWRWRRKALRERIRREGYTRPAMLYVEGRV